MLLHDQTSLPSAFSTASPSPVRKGPRCRFGDPAVTPWRPRTEPRAALLPQPHRRGPRFWRKRACAELARGAGSPGHVSGAGQCLASALPLVARRPQPGSSPEVTWGAWRGAGLLGSLQPAGACRGGRGVAVPVPGALRGPSPGVPASAGGRAGSRSSGIWVARASAAPGPLAVPGGGGFLQLPGALGQGLGLSLWPEKGNGQWDSMYYECVSTENTLP